MARRSIPEVNAGSMADIAFLLLIFFLVTTDITSNAGIVAKLPPRVPKQEQQEPPINERNLFVVLVNKNNQLFVEDRLMDIKDLRKAAIEFLDNGGGKGEEACSYCQGQHDPTSSDNPNKAVISLQNDRETNYETYITVQNELVAAYNELRERERQKLFKEVIKASLYLSCKPSLYLRMGVPTCSTSTNTSLIWILAFLPNFSWYIGKGSPAYTYITGSFLSNFCTWLAVGISLATFISPSLV